MVSEGGEGNQHLTSTSPTAQGNLQSRTKDSQAGPYAKATTAAAVIRLRRPKEQYENHQARVWM